MQSAAADIAASSLMSIPPATSQSSQETSQPDTYRYPPHFSFPPFFTLQPNVTTLSRQLALWSSLIQSYCAHHRTFRLSLAEAANSPLFHNSRINRRLDLLSIRRVFDYMVSAEGDRRAEWATLSRKKESQSQDKGLVWVFWKRPEEWADAVYAWVDGTGQRGSVLTFYELREGDDAGKQDWTGMDEELFKTCIEVLVKRGKAQIFGADDGAGIKFF